MSYVTHADLGGSAVQDPVVPEPDGDPFHEPWEPLAMALVLAMGATGSWNIDMSRAARETLPNYSRLSYFQIWLAALEKLMLERGQVFPDELEAGRMLHPPAPVKRVLDAGSVPAALARGSPTVRNDGPEPRFAPGQPVRTRAQAVAHHTRLPAYARGKRGVIERLHGSHVQADAHAQGQGERPEPLYTVTFDASELWGEDAAPGLRVSIDAWQSYLEPA
ncbi:MAG: Nitrile hydratase beta subunit [uncultured Ramlibacter sp.]|uniref:nitrile hydratase n=1 Tax=uncultured Ramlibacter sp. TaxID=260755 RepID=A0A6J4Q1V5_9BURK|nr:MAG: Nitrile hydratase beta subunit [uncultured Ramlibacter sp.]